jgi:hypothetical protein
VVTAEALLSERVGLAAMVEGRAAAAAAAAAADTLEEEVVMGQGEPVEEAGEGPRSTVVAYTGAWYRRAAVHHGERRSGSC